MTVNVEIQEFAVFSLSLSVMNDQEKIIVLQLSTGWASQAGVRTIVSHDVSG